MAEWWCPFGYASESEHFRPAELGCRHCGTVAIVPGALELLEATRSALGRPLALSSAFRCLTHNAAVGGARASQHLQGLAFDLRTAIPFDAVRRLGLWSGIGRSGSLATHVDARHLQWETNETGGQPDRPTVWFY